MNNKIFAYVRVSTKEQHTDRQIQAIDNYCINNDLEMDTRDVYIDKQSGKDFNRPSYQALKHTLREGDTLIIKELDRLGRDMEQVKVEWQELNNKCVNIMVIDNPILNTKNKSDLEKTLISNIVFELLSYMAEKERRKIKQRQAEGILSARNKGIAFGRPKVEVEQKKFLKIYKEWKERSITGVKAMEILGLTKATFYRRVKEYEGR